MKELIIKIIIYIGMGIVIWIGLLAFSLIRRNATGCMTFTNAPLLDNYLSVRCKEGLK